MHKNASARAFSETTHMSRFLTSRTALRLMPSEEGPLLDSIKNKPFLLKEVENSPSTVLLEGRVPGLLIMQIRFTAVDRPKKEPTKRENTFRRINWANDNVLNKTLMEIALTKKFYRTEDGCEEKYDQMLEVGVKYSCEIRLGIESYNVAGFHIPSFPVFIPPTCFMKYTYEDNYVIFCSTDPMYRVRQLIAKQFGKEHDEELWNSRDLFPRRVRPMFPKSTDVPS